MKYGTQCADGRRDPTRHDHRSAVAQVVKTYDKVCDCGPHVIVEYPDGE